MSKNLDTYTIAHLLIEESGNFADDLEYSPLDGMQYTLIDIVIVLLDCWQSASVFNWLMSVYQSYLS